MNAIHKPHGPHRGRRSLLAAVNALSAVAVLWAALPGALLGASVAAHAAEAAGAAGRTTEVGRSTQAWLALQRSNAQAAPVQPMLGTEAGLAYARYMDSFRTKIPESFGPLVTKGGNGNGTSN